MNREKQRELVEVKLRRNPELSDRQIAKELEVSPTTVGTVRKELEEKGEMSKLDTPKGAGKEFTLEASRNQLQEKISAIEGGIPKLREQEKRLRVKRVQILADIALSPGDKGLKMELSRIDKELEDTPKAIRDKEEIIKVLKGRLSDVLAQIRVSSKGKDVEEYLKKEQELESFPGRLKTLVDSLKDPTEDTKKLALDYCRVNAAFKDLKVDLADFMKRENVTSLSDLSLEEVKRNHLKDTSDQVSELFNLIKNLEHSLKNAGLNLALVLQGSSETYL